MSFLWGVRLKRFVLICSSEDRGHTNEVSVGAIPQDTESVNTLRSGNKHDTFKSSNESFSDMIQHDEGHRQVRVEVVKYIYSEPPPDYEDQSQQVPPIYVTMVE